MELLPSNRLVTYILTTFALTLLVQYFIKLVRLYTNMKKDTSVIKDYGSPPEHWLLGVARDIGAGPGQLNRLRNITTEFSPAVKCRMGPFVTLVLNHPTSARTLLNTAEPKDNFGYRYLKSWIGDGLLVSSGQKWARNRRLMTPAFHFDILKPYVDVFSESANALVNKLREECKKGKSIEMFQASASMTLDGLMKCIFGGEATIVQAGGKKHPYIQAVYDLSTLLLLRIASPQYASDLLYSLSWNGYKWRRACEVVHAYSQNVMKKKRQAKLHKQASDSEVNKPKYLGFMDILMDARDEDGVGLTDKEIQQEVDTFMFEGHDTTASGFTWFLYNMATHPEYQDKCRQEVQEVMGDRDQILWSDLGKLKYLAMCMKESLRMFPPVPHVGRELRKPMNLPDGTTLPAGFSVGASIYQVHHKPSVWENPEVYDPERFNPENSKQRHSHAFIPFSAGPRNCIGQHFAMNELKTAMAVVLKNFELSPDESKPAIPVAEVILRSTSGVWLHLKPLA